MSLFGILVLTTPLLLQGGVSIQSGSISQKAESRDCALNVANITGNVTVQNCPGIPTKAIEGLNRELKARRLSEDQARREAEKWRQEYEALQGTLATAGLSQALLMKASSYLNQGDLANAAKAFDEALKHQDQQVLEAASTHYYRAKVAELSFDTKTEAEHLDAAYRLAPHSIIIATEYGTFLTDHGRPSEGELVLKKLIDEAAESKTIDLEAATLINVSGSLRYQGKFVEAKEKLLQAASLWDICSKLHKPNSLNNEAVAFSGAASIAFDQQHSEEAKELIEKAIAIERRSIADDGDIPFAQANKLNLAHFLLISADVYSLAGDQDVAFAASEEASTLTQGISEADLKDRARGSLGEAKAAECLITARRHEPELAQKHCDEASATLEPLKDSEDGKFKSYLAQALLVSGMVLEDKQAWSQALVDFKRAESLWGELIEAGRAQFRADQAKAALYSVGASFRSGDHDSAAENARLAASMAESLPPQSYDLHREILAESAAVLESLGDHREASEIISKKDKLVPASIQ